MQTYFGASLLQHIDSFHAVLIAYSFTVFIPLTLTLILNVVIQLPQMNILFQSAHCSRLSGVACDLFLLLVHMDVVDVFPLCILEVILDES